MKITAQSIHRQSSDKQSIVITVHMIFLLMGSLLHNGSALLLSYFFSTSLKNDEATNRTVAIETGIQNSGLGLLLIFTFLDGNPEMALIAAWWGVWHLISGFSFATIMRRRLIVANN